MRCLVDECTGAAGEASGRVHILRLEGRERSTDSERIIPWEAEHETMTWKSISRLIA